MKLKCNKCKLGWDYKGKKKINPDYPIYTSCPRCYFKVKLKEWKTQEEIKESENLSQK